MITLNEMMSLAEAMADASDEVEIALRNLDIAKEHLRLIREETIPFAMQELGLTEMKLTDGRKLSVKQDVYASIPVSSKSEAYMWLDTNGFGGLIKVDVKIAYGKGGIGEAKELFSELAERGLGVELSENIHAQTLKAFIREQLANGSDIPLDIFGARPIWTAKITKNNKT